MDLHGTHMLSEVLTGCFQFELSTSCFLFFFLELDFLQFHRILWRKRWRSTNLSVKACLRAGPKNDDTLRLKTTNTSASIGFVTLMWLMSIWTSSSWLRCHPWRLSFNLAKENTSHYSCPSNQAGLAITPSWRAQHSKQYFRKRTSEVVDGSVDGSTQFLIYHPMHSAGGRARHICLALPPAIYSMCSSCSLFVKS